MNLKSPQRTSKGRGAISDKAFGGGCDRFYQPELCLETANGIHNARLVLYKVRAHAASSPTGVSAGTSSPS